MTADKKFLSFFSGAGGLDLGLEQAGWECVYANDNDPKCVETLSRNRGADLGGGRRALRNARIEAEDIRALDVKSLMKDLGIRPGQVPLIAGGPPCQAWSSAGSQRGFSDPRGLLSEAYVEIAEAIQPRLILFENVRGLLTARGRDGEYGGALSHLRKEFLSIGYGTTVQLLNAADFGVPQRRVRLFIIAFRDPVLPSFPTPSHHRQDKGASGVFDLMPWVTLGECLESLAPVRPDEVIRPSAKLARELATIPAGNGLKSPGKKETTRPGGHWGYKQGAFIADLSRAARTVTASSQQDWIRDERQGLRRLCPREVAAVQTFPSNWEFCGSRADEYRQIGNAVPPMLAKALGDALARYISQPEQGAAANRKRLELLALPAELQAAIAYSKKDDERNGASRRAVSPRRQHTINSPGNV